MCTLACTPQDLWFRSSSGVGWAGTWSSRPWTRCTSSWTGPGVHQLHPPPPGPTSLWFCAPPGFDLRRHGWCQTPQPSTSVHNFCTAYFLVDEASTTATGVCLVFVVKNIAGAVRDPQKVFVFHPVFSLHKEKSTKTKDIHNSPHMPEAFDKFYLYFITFIYVSLNVMRRGGGLDWTGGDPSETLQPVPCSKSEVFKSTVIAKKQKGGRKQQRLSGRLRDSLQAKNQQFCKFLLTLIYRSMSRI